MIGRNILWIALILVPLTACSVLYAQTNTVPGPKEWGQPVDDLQFSLYLASDKTDRFGIPDIALAIRNLGSSLQKVGLGDGGPPLRPGLKTNNVRLVLTDETGRSQELIDFPGPPLIAGSGGGGGTLWVEVAPGATTAVPIDLNCYYVEYKTGKYAWAGGGTYSLRAEFVLPAHFLAEKPFGLSNRQTIRSNELRLHFAANVTSVRCFSNGAEAPCSK